MRSPHRRVKTLLFGFLLVAMTPVIDAKAQPAIVSPVIADDRFETLVADAKAAMLTDPAVAISRAAAAKFYAGLSPAVRQRPLMRATAQWLEGEAYIRLNDIARAGPLIDGALAIAARTVPGSKLHGDLLLSAGGIATEQANVAQALTDYQGAYAIFLRLGETRSRAKSLIQIAALYAFANDYINALKYYGQALEIYKADPGLSVAILNGRGSAFNEMKRFAEADSQFQQALVLARKMDSPLLMALVLGNIASARLAAGDLAAADRAIAEGLQATKTKDAANFRRHIIAISARSAFEARRMGEATRLIQESFIGLDLEKTTLFDRDAHETAYLIFRQLGKFDEAFRHLAALKRLDEEATKLARSTSAALMGARFDFANQELRIAKLKADDLQKSVAFERARASTQRLVFVGIAGATLIIIAMLGFGLFTIRRSRNQVCAANIDLAATNDALGKALAAKTEFLATTSHEIRTPLNGILGMTQVMLADASISAATRDRVGVVHGAGVTMRALVDDILDVAKMETGNLTIESVPFDVYQTIDDATRMWEAQAATKGLGFAVLLDDCPARIIGDPARLRQIVFNLLSNAVKFTPVGTVTVSAQGRGQDRFRIVVADTGIGIAPDKHEEIFESFRQADAGTTRQFGGTGLGLSICRSLSRAMGGDVTVESIEGGGATFTLELPLIAASTEAAPEVARATGGVLVVDRNPITRAMFKALLTPRGGAVSFAADLDEAQAVIEAELPANVLIDDATARASGTHIESLTAIAAVAAVAGARVALLWPLSADVERAELLATGVDQVIARPIAKDALVSALFDPQPLVSQAA